KRQALNDQLPRNLRARRTDRKPRREFLRTQFRSRQRDVRKIHAANQEDKCGTSPEQIQRRPNATNEDVLQPFNCRVETSVDKELFELRKSFEVRGIDRIDLLLGLHHRRARFQSADVIPAVAVPEIIRLLLGSESKRYPEPCFGIGKLEAF